MLCSGQEQARPVSAHGPQRKIFSAIAGLVLLLGMGCRRSVVVSPGFTIEQAITPQPARVGRSTLTFMITDAGKPVDGAQLAVEADMTHAGMKPEFADVKETQPGRYEGEVNLPMAGDWVILLHGKLRNGTAVEKQFDVRGVRPD